MSKNEEYYDKDVIRDRREKSKKHKRDGTKEGKNAFNRRRARQADSERSRSEEYFY